MGASIIIDLGSRYATLKDLLLQICERKLPQSEYIQRREDTSAMICESLHKWLTVVRRVRLLVQDALDVSNGVRPAILGSHSEPSALGTYVAKVSVRVESEPWWSRVVSQPVSKEIESAMAENTRGMNACFLAVEKLASDLPGFEGIIDRFLNEEGCTKGVEIDRVLSTSDPFVSIYSRLNRIKTAFSESRFAADAL